MSPFDNNSITPRDSRHVFHHRFQVESTKTDLAWAFGLAIFSGLVAAYISGAI